MKRILIIAAAVLALVACQKNLPVSLSDSGEIRFGTTGIRVETKAFSETTSSTLQANGFKVAAVIDADHSVMFNNAVAYANGVYSVPGEHYYWPKTGTMSFYGVYPKTQAVSVNSGVATLSYTQNADTDLIAAKAAAVSKTNDEVVMAFDHILSQLSIKVQGEETTVDYKLFSLTLTAPNGGTYAYADGSWTPSATTADNSVYSNESGMEVSTSEMVAIGSAMSFIPGDISLNVVWKCYNKTSDKALLCEKDVTIDVTLTAGKSTALELTLPFSGTELTFSLTVGSWLPDPQSLVVKYEPKLVSGVFTVCASPLKKVKFTKGNLYWDGADFRCENHQYDYPTAWDANHVGHFKWGSTVDDVIKNYTSTPSGSTFFAADGRAIEGYTVLSKDEWDYLIAHSLEGGSSAKKVTVNGKNCVILKPDGFDGTVADSYTAEEWVTAESTYGLVALPFAGYYNGTNVGNAGSDVGYWSSVPNGSNAWIVDFSSGSASVNSGGRRDLGDPVRLVSVVD